MFQCEWDPGMCETWSPDSGANACIVVDGDHGNVIQPPEAATRQYPYVAITGWTTSEDETDPHALAAMFDEKEWPAAARDIAASQIWSTRLGGVPAWVQYPEFPRGEGWTFIGQIDPDAGANFGDGGMAYLFRQGDRFRMLWQCG